MTTPEFALLVPIKDGSTAKSRLGVGEDGQRGRLMAAFARDSVTAACACDGVEVYVVGHPSALAELGVEVLPDEGGGDLNLALSRAAERVVRPGRGIAAMLADLPCLRTADLAAALAAATVRSFVADAAGTGTTLLAAPPGTALQPRFGAGSARAHELSGAVALTAALSSLRLDVDTTSDLADALRFGVGDHTALVASSLA
ncbi:MAG: 2-phospho-L-lactate guanylyltransferase [Marmoricola sp.]|nr:2-phospho-L-lactate guanylyltransferase [Marmoricola sp.]